MLGRVADGCGDCMQPRLCDLPHAGARPAICRLTRYQWGGPGPCDLGRLFFAAWECGGLQHGIALAGDFPSSKSSGRRAASNGAIAWIEPHSPSRAPRPGFCTGDAARVGPAAAPTPRSSAGISARVGPAGAHTSHLCREWICSHRKSPGQGLSVLRVEVSECRSRTCEYPLLVGLHRLVQSRRVWVPIPAWCAPSEIALLAKGLVESLRVLEVKLVWFRVPRSGYPLLVSLHRLVQSP